MYCILILFQSQQYSENNRIGRYPHVEITYFRVMELINRNNLTKAELEEKIGLSNSVIDGWETNNPMSSSLSAVADYFNVTVDYLLGRTDDPSPYSDSRHLPESTLELVQYIIELNPSAEQIPIMKNRILNLYIFNKLEVK